MNVSFRQSFKYLLWVALLAGMTMGALWYWREARLYPSTDNAYIQANVIRIAPQVSGRVLTVRVKENQVVHQGDVLFTIDPSLYLIQVQKAKANLENTQQQVNAQALAVKIAKANLEKAQAQLSISEKNAKRILSLVHDGRASKQQGDDVRTQLTVAKADYVAADNEFQRAQQILGDASEHNAQIQAAKEQLKEAQLNLQYTQVTAPHDGIITQLSLREGDIVNTNVPQFSIVENTDMWIAANFKETALGRIRPQQTVKIHIDMYPDVTFEGTVDSVSPGSGSAFALLPPENASGNWVKVTQRFPVKIRLKQDDPKYPLRLGASCKVTVDTV